MDCEGDSWDCGEMGLCCARPMTTTAGDGDDGMKVLKLSGGQPEMEVRNDGDPPCRDDDRPTTSGDDAVEHRMMMQMLRSEEVSRTSMNNWTTSEEKTKYCVEALALTIDNDR